MSVPSGGGDDLGVAKVLRLDLSRHTPVVVVVVAEFAIFSPAPSPQGASLRHSQGVQKTIAAGRHEHW